MKKRVAIIGGGASGVLSAILLSKKYDVTIYERQSRILKKVLQSGNGMCNLTNENINDLDILSKYNTDLIKDTLNEFDYNKCIDTFKELGLITKIDSEGRCYPYSKKATTVVDVLNRALEEGGVKVMCDTLIDNIKVNNTFLLNGKYSSDILIMSTGSKSNLNFKYNGYDLVNSLGIKMTKLSPSLVGFKTVENVRSLTGLRMKALVKLLIDGEVISSGSGEVQFKDDGVSGIVVMELSRLYDKNKKCSLSIDLMKEYSEKELFELINSLYNRYHSFEDALKGILPKMMYLDILKKSKNINDIVYNIKNYTLNIKDTYDYEFSQVTRGGVDLNEINMNNYSSKKIDNLYFVGELLDVDGTCGGYNLHFAWASAYKVSKFLNEGEK